MPPSIQCRIQIAHWFWLITLYLMLMPSSFTMTIA